MDVAWSIDPSPTAPADAVPAAPSAAQPSAAAHCEQDVNSPTSSDADESEPVARRATDADATPPAPRPDAAQQSSEAEETPPSPPPDAACGIFWDYENVNLPGDVCGFELSNRLRAIALRFGQLCERRLYHDPSKRTLGEERRGPLDQSGFTLVDCPTRSAGGALSKEAIDKKIIVDVMLFAMTHVARRQKAWVVLLTSDGDYAYMLARLRDLQVGVVVIYDAGCVAPALLHASDVAMAWGSEVLCSLPRHPRLASSCAHAGSWHAARAAESSAEGGSLRHADPASCSRLLEVYERRLRKCRARPEREGKAALLRVRIDKLRRRLGLHSSEAGDRELARRRWPGDARGVWQEAFEGAGNFEGAGSFDAEVVASAARVDWSVLPSEDADMDGEHSAAEEAECHEDGRSYASGGGVGDDYIDLLPRLFAGTPRAKGKKASAKAKDFKAKGIISGNLGPSVAIKAKGAKAKGAKGRGRGKNSHHALAARRGVHK